MLALLMTGLEPAGAVRTNVRCVTTPVIGLSWGVPGKAMTTTGPL